MHNTCTGVCPPALQSRPANGLHSSLKMSPTQQSVLLTEAVAVLSPSCLSVQPREDRSTRSPAIPQPSVQVYLHHDGGVHSTDGIVARASRRTDLFRSRLVQRRVGPRARCGRETGRTHALSRVSRASEDIVPEHRAPGSAPPPAGVAANIGLLLLLFDR